MANRVGTRLFRDLDLAFGDQRPRDRRAQQILAFVNGVGAEHGEHEIAHEFLAQVVDEDFLHAHLFGFGARGRDFLALADVGGEGDDFTVVSVLQPFENDRGVEAAGIGEHYFLDIRHGGVVPVGEKRRF